MAGPSYTYTLTNGTTASATEVMQDFNDILNGVTDGTKDLSISALTCAGNVAMNANVTLGNASGDDITITGSIAATVALKTQRTYDIGGTDIGLRILYLGGNSTYTVALQAPSSGMSADYSLTLPSTVGATGQFPYNSGSGALAWFPGGLTSYALSGGNYTVLDNDGYGRIYVTTSTSTRTITLPTAADNSGRTIKVVKVDQSTGKVAFAGEASELVGPTVELVGQYESCELACDGTSWRYLSTQFHSRFFRAYKSAGAGVKGADGVVALGIDTITSDALGWFVESASTASAYFLPNAAGYYLCTFTAGYASQPDNVEWSIYMQHAADGSSYSTAAQLVSSGNGDDVTGTLTSIIYMDGSNDRLRVAFSNVNATDVTCSAGSTRCWFQAQWIGA